MKGVFAATATMAAFAAFIGMSGPANAQVSDDAVRIGVLTDLSGPYADFTGPGSVLADQRAIEDAGRPMPLIALPDDEGRRDVERRKQ